MDFLFYLKDGALILFTQITGALLVKVLGTDC